MKDSFKKILSFITIAICYYLIIIKLSEYKVLLLIIIIAVSIYMGTLYNNVEKNINKEKFQMHFISNIHKEFLNEQERFNKLNYRR